MIKRKITDVLLAELNKYPVVTLLGPRQSGKTTLVKNALSNYAYVNLEDPELRLMATNDPKGFLKQNSCPLIIDEIQRVPELLSYIQVIVDESPKEKGMFVLTGSQQLNLKANITQSLAGRTALLKLLPLSINELKNAGVILERDEYIFKGFMPRGYQENIAPKSLYRNYYETYIERDVNQLVNLRNRSLFELFLKLLAGRVGQLLNLNSMSGDIGVSSTTLNEWLNVLESSFIIFRLPPYYENFGKRFIKSPKIYFTEIGLAAYLLEIRNPSQVSRDPLMGNLFENMVILEALKARYNAGENPDLYFFRDQHGFEIDLIKSEHRKITPIEIKSAMTFSPKFTNNLKKFTSLNDKISNGILIYSGNQYESYNRVKIMNFKNIESVIMG